MTTESLTPPAGLDVVTPADPGWDDARRAWNLAVNQRPAAVAMPRDAGEVAAAVAHARAAGLRVAVQGTGHGAGPRRDLQGALLINTSRMRGASVDPASRSARAEAGAQWRDVVPLAAEHGLAALQGSAPDVGVVGYTLGGGAGWLGRRYGLAANAVTAIELVTAAGEPVRADAETEPDLFWALRGGGGNFGVVTALEFRLYPVDSLNAGWLVWPWEETRRVLGRWSEWVETVPDEVSSVGRIMQLPDLPDLPEVVRGRRLVVVDAAILADEGEAARLLAPLRELGPELDTFAQVPATALSELHMDPPEPVPAAADGRRHRRVPARGRQRPGGRRRPRLGLPAGHRRAPPHRRCARAGARRRGRPRPHRRPLPALRRRHRDVPGGGGGRGRGGGAGEGGHVGVGLGTDVPELRRRPGRDGDDVRPRGRTGACARSGPGSTPTGCSWRTIRSRRRLRGTLDAGGGPESRGRSAVATTTGTSNRADPRRPGRGPADPPVRDDPGRAPHPAVAAVGGRADRALGPAAAVMRSLQSMFDHGPAGRHRLHVDPPGGPGHRALGGRLLRARTPTTSTRSRSSSWRWRAGCNAVATTLGGDGPGGAPLVPPHPVPAEAQPQRVPVVPERVRPDHVRLGAPGARAGRGGGRRDDLLRLGGVEAADPGGLGGLRGGPRARHGHGPVVLPAQRGLQQDRRGRPRLPRRHRPDGPGEPPRRHDRGRHHQAEAARDGGPGLRGPEVRPSRTPRCTRSS